MEDPKNEALVISTYMIEADIFQPIATRVLPATNTRPERIAVTAGMGVRRVYTRWELKVPPVGERSAYTLYQLHREAARRMIRELGWPVIDFWVQGGKLGKFDHVFTCCGNRMARQAALAR